MEGCMCDEWVSGGCMGNNVRVPECIHEKQCVH